MNEVRQQYETWIYPSPAKDLEEDFRKGCFDLSDPGLFRRKLWPRPVEPENLKILVAGCGTDQAARLAHRNPSCSVTGVDFSESSLAHEDYLKNKHGLTNLRLRHLGILDVDQLGDQFDLIVSTGVLHHLPDPDAGLRKLKSVLSPHGVMSLMVYGAYARFGVYMMQEVFRLLGVPQTSEGVKLVRATLGALPAWHHVKPFVRNSPDLERDDAEVVDVFLHPKDRAYSVPEVLRFALQNGLQFQDWLDGHEYAVAARIPKSFPLYAQALELKREEQWQLVELVAQTIACHRFLLCHADRDSRDYGVLFDSQHSGEPWLSYVPMRRFPLDVMNPQGTWQPYGSHVRPPDAAPPSGDAPAAAPLTLRRYSHPFTLDGPEAALFDLVDGQSTIGQIVKKASTHPEQLAANRSLAFRLFARMREWDHLMFRI